MKKIVILAAVALMTAALPAAPSAKTKVETENSQKVEARAQRMVKGAVSLFEQNEDERAIGMLEGVQRMYPNSQARFNASLELGRHFIDKRVFDRALAELRKVDKAENPETRAEALLLQGKLHLANGQGGEAVMVLRRLVHDYPTSDFSNDAYFTIGQIHFEAGRWARAVEAFEMVGTAVPEGVLTNDVVLVEAGQRVFAHVRDKDLAVLAQLGKKSYVEFKSQSGDVEKAELTSFGRGDGDFIASVKTVAADSKPGDGFLTVHGSEPISVVYVDANDEKGAFNINVTAGAEVVSSAVLQFMDGAERQRVNGVFVGQPAFVRLRDNDLDKSAGADTVTVTLRAQYQERPEAAPGEAQPPAAAPDAPWITRSEIPLVLRETGPRTGVFSGRIIPRLLPDGTNAPSAKLPANEIGVRPEDHIVVEYEDVKHLGGSKPEIRTATAVALVGGSTEPQSIVSHSNDANIQARKLLLEAKLLCKWGSIFKEVGLQENAKAKADDGLNRISEIFDLASRNSLDRSVIEETYEARWDLQLVNDDLAGAIATCRALVRRYPDTLLAERAFMQIANARLLEGKPESIQSAISVLGGILSLPNSQLKAEAQFRIGEAQEKLAREFTQPNSKPDFSAAIGAYRRCAELYPTSSFAGESFKRIVDYDVSVRNYTAATEIIERVFEDYPDAPWLDEMLLKWGVVLNRLGDKDGAKDKFRRILEEYPGGKPARTASEFLKRLQAAEED